MPERVAGYDLAQELMRRAPEKKRRIFFFGSAPGVAELAKKKAESLYPGIEIVEMCIRDRITGFVTKGRGVSVHRSDCPNVLRDNDLSRMIEVSWDIGLDKDYTVEIEIVCNDKSGVLAELLAVPSEMKINIHSVNANPNRSNKTSTVVMGLDVKNATQVAQIMTKMRRLKNVYSVSLSLIHI